MSSLFFLIYLGVCYFIIRIILNDELAAKYPLNKRILACVAGILFVTLFFLPYILGFVKGTRSIPATLFSLPFFLIAIAVCITQIFYPQKARQYTRFYIKATAAVIALLCLTPLVLSIGG